MIREEAFSQEELIELRRIMTDETADTTEVSREILAGEATLDWIESVLNPGW
jgi:hypothetical protein